MVQKSVYPVFQNIGPGITPAVKRGFLPVNLHADKFIDLYFLYSCL